MTVKQNCLWKMIYNDRETKLSALRDLKVDGYESNL